MDHTILRHAHPTKLAAYLREAAAGSTTKAITEELLSAIFSGLLPPRIFTVWLSASHDADVIRDAIHQDRSRVVRSAAIRQFGRLFCGPRVEEAWKALGGTSGLLEVLSNVSVNDVKAFCSELGKGGTVVLERERRRRYADELFKALCHQHFPDTELRTADTRPLLSHYQLLLPACSSELVLRYIESEAASPGYHTRRLLEAHSSLFRDKCFGSMFDQGDNSDSTKLYQDLLDGLSTDTPAEEEPQISTSMLFAIRLLQRYSQGTTSNSVVRHTFENHIVTPLLRKLARRNCKPEVWREVVRMVVQCAKKYHSEGCHSLKDMAKKGPMRSIVSRWVRHPEQLETSLIDYLDILPPHSVFQGYQLVMFLESIPMAMRWPLLTILMSHAPGAQVDLTSEVDLQRFKSQWPVTLFLIIPPNHARLLLERLVKVKPDGDFIGWNWPRGKRGTQHRLPLHHDDSSMCLMIYLSRNHPNGLEKAKLAIEESRKEATTAREQSDRVSWIKKALDFAVASGSLAVYHRTLSWARRFNKDQNTIRVIYSEASLHTDEALDLLCGFPADCDISNVTIEDVRSNVTLGNRTCGELFDAACMAQKEPSFHQPHWEPILDLFEAVTRLRLERIDQLQDSLSLSDEEVYDLVWKDTLDTCLTLERTGLEEEQTQLEFNTAGGPLHRGYNISSNLPQPRQAALKFVDDLAKERNAMWETYRVRNNPNTVTLAAHYPRGLAIQHIFPLDVRKWREGFNLPYLRERAEAVVFVDPSFALSPAPKDKETRKTVARFVENYETALKLYVSAYPLREQQALAAWKHAIGPLSAPRMSTGEAFVFWKDIFANVFQDMRVTGPWSHSYLGKLPDPSLPLVDDAETGEPIEWNPDPEAAQYAIEGRELEPTVLDQMMGYGIRPYDKIDSDYIDSSQFIHGAAAGCLWERFTAPQMSPMIQEALIAAGLLHLNGKRCDSHRLLTTPFPSSSAVRFPALLLDDEFLDRKELEDTGSLISCLQKLEDSIPPSLLLQLVRGMFDELEVKEKDAKLAHDAFAMLKLLSKSDRPDLALDIVLEVILNRPDDSTWHRSLLTSGLVDILPAQKAKAFTERIAQSIQMRLHGRSVRTSETGNSPKFARLPAVKITTVKLLAQLTARAEYIDESTSVSILQGLMVNALHLDITVAVVQSLIHIFTGCADRNIKDIILKVLEVHAVPIAGSLNERIPMTADDWAEAEGIDKDLPEVYMESDRNSLGPILTLLVDAAKTSSRLSAEERNEVIARLLLPALHLSAQANQRWMALFCKHLQVPAMSLPLFPVKAEFLTQMFEHPSYLPGWAARSWLAMFTIVKRPEPAMSQINTRIREDVELRESNAGKHWLSLWTEPNTAGKMTMKMLTQLLTFEWQSAIPDGIDLSQIQDLVFQQGDMLIKTADEQFANWVHFTSELLLLNPRQTKSMWLERCGPVVQNLITHINSLRTPAWQENPSRFPEVLPDTLKLRTWPLVYAHLSHRDRDSHRLTFVTQISDLIDEIARSTTLHHEQFTKLTDVLVGTRRFPQDESYALAFALGDVDFLSERDAHLADLLRVKLASDMLLSWPHSLRAWKTEVLQLLDDWSRCRVEEIRMIGLATCRIARQRAGNWSAA